MPFHVIVVTDTHTNKQTNRTDYYTCSAKLMAQCKYESNDKSTAFKSNFHSMPIECVRVCVLNFNKVSVIEFSALYGD